MYNMEKHNGDKFRKEMRKRQGMKKQHDGRRHMPQGDVKKINMDENVKIVLSLSL